MLPLLIGFKTCFWLTWNKSCLLQLSIVCSYVCKLFMHIFNISFKFTEPLMEGDWVLFIWSATSFPTKNDKGMVNIHWRFLEFFFFRTTWPISTIPDTDHSFSLKLVYRYELLFMWAMWPKGPLCKVQCCWFRKGTTSGWKLMDRFDWCFSWYCFQIKVLTF